jgi:SAM-dependent methyltransferase
MNRWEAIARLEPYYAVLSQDRYLRARFDESANEFFESGERDVEQALALAKASGRTAPIRDVLEFGCGPGRLLPALTRRGFNVTAVDVAPSMLALARSSAAGPVTFLELDAFLRGDSTFDLILVSRVLQHIPQEEGLALLRALADRLHDDGVLQINVPFQTERRLLSRAALAARERAGALNAAANRMKHRPAHVPVLRPHVYSLDRVLRVLHDGACDVSSVTVKRENELTTAFVAARKRVSGAQRRVTVDVDAAQRVLAPDAIDPAEMIRTIDIDALNARAEEYFARTDVWDEQLAKPFGSVTEAPAMLVSLGVLLHGAHLVPGMTVLDFGGGTGWLSRLLMQFGCNAILCDVSQSALRIATNFIERTPPIGAKPGTFRTLLFDGRMLDLPDESLDRILCFDSFHHVPNVDATIHEFARVLKPGGLAAFSEPGPHHSQSAQSQFEMRVHGVLENDVDVPRIWATARAAGFDDIKLVPFNGTPTYMSLRDFDDFLRGGAALDGAAQSLREFTANVRTFTLKKSGIEALDSRTTGGLSCDIEVEMQERAFTARVTNTGTATWLPAKQSPGGVSLGVHLYRESTLVDFDFLWTPLGEREVQPGEEVTVHGVVPPLPAGRHVLEFDCVARGVTWFSQVGSKTTRVETSL